MFQLIVYNFLLFVYGLKIDPKSREVILNACKAVGSISNTSFDIRFNPDIFSPGMKKGIYLNPSPFFILHEQLW